jgi:hypothetical protein
MRGLGGTPPIKPEHSSANGTTKPAYRPEFLKGSLATCFECGISKDLRAILETSSPVLSQVGSIRKPLSEGDLSLYADPLNSGSVVLGVTATNAIQSRVCGFMHKGWSSPRERSQGIGWES